MVWLRSENDPIENSCVAASGPGVAKVGSKNVTGNSTKRQENVGNRCVSVTSAFSEKVAG